jgi:D-3-phosphoglycerate dehydrogenase
MPLIAIPDPIEPAGIDLLKAQAGFEVAACHALSVAERRQIVTQADGVIVRSFKIDAALIRAAPRLRIASKHGAGYDNIDVEAASQSGVIVANVPGGNALAVAEGAVALMLAALRRTPKVHAHVAGGDYAARRDMNFEQLSDRTLGLIGLGAIGRHVARICSRGFDMTVLAYDPYVRPETLEGLDIDMVNDLDALLRRADIVSLHVPMTADMHHMIDADRLRQMRRHAVLVNTARGPLVDPAALATALKEGWIAGAGIDVFETEPPPPDHVLFDAPNIVLSPHVAGSTFEANRNLSILACRNVIDTLAGVPPAGLVNEDVWEARRR